MARKTEPYYAVRHDRANVPSGLEAFYCYMEGEPSYMVYVKDGAVFDIKKAEFMRMAPTAEKQRLAPKIARALANVR